MKENSYLSNELIEALDDFNTDDLTQKISRIEGLAGDITSITCKDILKDLSATQDAVLAAKHLKILAGQINVSIHALGILRCLPHILEEGEAVESMSLGAGNTGKIFDLETSKRVAEFKFINWKGGAEAIRQNGIFKDFFGLAEAETAKSKHLYLLGIKYPLKFFEGKRSIKSVLSKDRKVAEEFDYKYGQSYKVVQEYFTFMKSKVFIEDVSNYVPELVQDFANLNT